MQVEITTAGAPPGRWIPVIDLVEIPSRRASTDFALFASAREIICAGPITLERQLESSGSGRPSR